MKRKNVKINASESGLSEQLTESKANVDPIGRILMLLGFEPKKTVLDNVMHLLSEVLDNSDASLGRVISDRLALTNVAWEEVLPEIIDSISGTSSSLSPKLQGTIDALSNLLFARVGDDGALAPASKPSMSDYVKLISFFKRMKGMKRDRSIDSLPASAGTVNRRSIFD